MTPANPYLYASLSKNFLSLKLNSPFLSLSLYIYLFVCLLYTFSLFLSLFFVSLIYLQSFYTLILLTSFYISISIWWSLLFDPRIRLVSCWIQLGTLYFSVFFFLLVSWFALLWVFVYLCEFELTQVSFHAHFGVNVVGLFGYWVFGLWLLVLKLVSFGMLAEFGELGIWSGVVG